MRTTDVATFSSAKFEETVATMKARRETVHEVGDRVFRATGKVDPLVDINGKTRKSRNALVREGDKTILKNGPAMPLLTVFDGTASMGENVGKAFFELGTIYDMLGFARERYNMQLSSAVVQDVDDSKPVYQQTQFESDNRIAEQLRLLLAAESGGDPVEDYDMALAYVDRAVQTDIYTMYGLKGYMMIVGDQEGRGSITKEAAMLHLGIGLQSTTKTSDLARSLNKAWHTFYLQVARGGQAATRNHVTSFWESTLGKGRVVLVPNADLIAETQVAIIYITENVGVTQQRLVDFLIETTRGTNQPISQRDANAIWYALEVAKIDAGAQTRLPNFGVMPKPGDEFENYRHAWPIGHPKAEGQAVFESGEAEEDVSTPRPPRKPFDWSKF